MVMLMFLMTSGDFQERRVLKAEQERVEAVAARCFFLHICSCKVLFSDQSHKIIMKCSMF